MDTTILKTLIDSFGIGGIMLASLLIAIVQLWRVLQRKDEKISSLVDDFQTSIRELGTANTLALQANTEKLSDISIKLGEATIQQKAAADLTNSMLARFDMTIAGSHHQSNNELPRSH